MTIYLVRHGAALDMGEAGISKDFDRPLSKEGRRKTEEVAAGLAALGVAPELIGASPLVRAQETARILGSVLCPDRRVELCPCLQPDAPLAAAVEWLRGAGVESVMAVGHMPDIAELAALLLAGEADLQLVFKKAAVACISFEKLPAAGCGRL